MNKSFFEQRTIFTIECQRKKNHRSKKSIFVYFSKFLFVEENLIDFDDEDNVEQGDADDGTVDNRVIVAGEELFDG